MHCSAKVSLWQLQMTYHSAHIIMIGGIKNNNNRRHQDENNMLNLTLSRKHWWLPESIYFHVFFHLSAWQTNISERTVPCWLQPASIHCNYLPSLAGDTHYSLKPLRASEGVSRALIRRSYLYSESTDARAHTPSLQPASLPRIRTDAAAHSS